MLLIQNSKSHFDGKIDPDLIGIDGFKIFNYELTPVQIKTLYPIRNQGSNGVNNSGATRFGPLTGSP